jgi:hypothetical protein
MAEKWHKRQGPKKKPRRPFRPSAAFSVEKRLFSGGENWWAVQDSNL